MESYRGQQFSKEQMLFVIETVLVSTLDCIENALSAVIDYPNISHDTVHDAMVVSLETAGMTLAVFYAKITDDGLGIYDALGCAGKFNEACQKFVEVVCENRKLLNEKHREYKGTVKDFYNGFKPGCYPDCKKHAKAFIKQAFGDAWFRVTPT